MNVTDSTTGVYYQSEDYAGLLRRVLIAIVDGLIIGVCWYALNTLCWHVCTNTSCYALTTLLSPLVLAYVYLAIMKPRWGTLGYWITGVRIVDMFGQRPSLIRMTGRFLWLTFHPLSMFLDLVWLTGEETRQTLRDKMVGTYVIRKKAQPLGTGQYGLKIITLGPLCLRVREVKVPSLQSAEIDENSVN